MREGEMRRLSYVLCQKEEEVRKSTDSAYGPRNREKSTRRGALSAEVSTTSAPAMLYIRLRRHSVSLQSRYRLLCHIKEASFL